MAGRGPPVRWGYVTVNAHTHTHTHRVCKYSLLPVDHKIRPVSSARNLKVHAVMMMMVMMVPGHQEGMLGVTAWNSWPCVTVPAERCQTCSSVRHASAPPSPLAPGTGRACPLRSPSVTQVVLPGACLGRCVPLLSACSGLNAPFWLMSAGGVHQVRRRHIRDDKLPAVSMAA